MNATNGASALNGLKGQQESPYLAMIGDAQAELERLRIQHRWLQICLKDRIAFAPVDLKKEGLRVLDMGCADGTLLRDLQKQVSPSAEMVGADLSTVFLPIAAEGNIRYLTQDICEPPADELRGKFDFTHVRNVLHSSGRSGVEKAVENLVDTLAPGGWLQAMEMDMNGGQPDQPQAMQDAMKVISTMMAKAGMDPEYPKKLPAAFEKAGLRNVTLERIDCGIGKAHSNQSDMESSIAPFRRTIPLVTKQVKVMCPELPPSVYENLEERYVKEMTEKGGFFPAFIVYGQKPAA